MRTLRKFSAQTVKLPWDILQTTQSDSTYLLPIVCSRSEIIVNLHSGGMCEVKKMQPKFDPMDLRGDKTK